MPKDLKALLKEKVERMKKVLEAAKALKKVSSKK